MKKTYETDVAGIRILPGQWRPHYPFEQIAWVSPPWPSQDYLWLDFPEAIFTRAGLLYLSHNNPAFPTLFPEQPGVAWQPASGGIRFERRLPNQVKLGGSVTRSSDTTVALKLFLENHSPAAVTDIQLQTCVFLRGIQEFGDYTQENKFVHVPEAGWLLLEVARKRTEETGRYRLGWRGGPKIADWPVLVTLSSQAERLVAMTWHNHTRSLIGNPRHPCMHADPCFPDLPIGERAEISGELIFFEGSLEDFSKEFQG